MAKPDPRSPAKNSQRIWLFGLALIVATALAYLPAWNGKPIWDDNAHITQPELRSGHGLVEIWTQVGATQQYYPLVHSVFWVEQKLWGDSVTGYHLVNILHSRFGRGRFAPDFAAPESSGRVAGRRSICSSSCSSRIGRLDFGAQEHALRSLLITQGLISFSELTNRPHSSGS